MPSARSTFGRCRRVCAVLTLAGGPCGSLSKSNLDRKQPYSYRHQTNGDFHSFSLRCGFVHQHGHHATPACAKCHLSARNSSLNPLLWDGRLQNGHIFCGSLVKICTTCNEVFLMPISSSMSLRNRSSVQRQADHSRAASFFETHPVGEIIRGLFLSSALWALLAISVYLVYSMVLSSN